MCGVTTTLSKAMSVLSGGGGYLANTSRAARKRPLVGASTNAPLPMSPSRAVLTRTAPGFTRVSADRSSRLSVSEIRGTCSDTTSNSLSRLSRARRSIPRSERPLLFV